VAIIEEAGNGENEIDKYPLVKRRCSLFLFFTPPHKSLIYNKKQFNIINLFDNNDNKLIIITIFA